MGKNLLADDGVGRNLLAEAPQGVNLLAEDKGAEAPSFLDHMGGLLANTPMIGTIQPDMVPNEAWKQFALGAQGTVRTIEAAGYELPDAEALRQSPEGQARMAQLRAEKKISEELVAEYQKDDNAVAKVVGDALQSLPSSLVTLAPAVLLPTGPAVGIGLGGNALLEGADELVHRVQDLGQDRDKAYAGALRHSAVSTALEAGPLSAAAKLIKGAAPLKQVAGKIFLGEGLQEGGTQLFDDVSTNVEDLTSFTSEDMAKRAGHATAVGMVQGGLMGPFAHGVHKAQMYGAKKKYERELEDAALGEEEQLRQLEAQLGAAVGGLSVDDQTPLAGPALTLEEQKLAAIQKAQLQGALDGVETTPEGVRYGETLRNVLGQVGLGQGRTAVEEEAASEIGGMTAEVLARREETAESDLLPIDLRRIVGSTTDEKVLGLTLQQTGELPAGAVVMLEGNEDLFPSEVMKPVLDTLGEWVKKVMPDARIVLNQEQLPGGEFGAHQAVVGETGNLTHVLTLRELPSYMAEYEGGNPKTKMEFVATLSHEFGHALKSQNFFKGLEALGGKGQMMVQAQLRQGAVSAELMAQLEQVAPVEAALISRWMDLRNRVLDGTMSAKEFVESWVGMRKLGDSMNPKRAPANKHLYTWADAVLKAKGLNHNTATALELVEAAYGEKEAIQYGLNFDEFMAEQFSRAAYTTGMLEGSSIGKFFSKTLGQLRDLFRMLKGEKLIAPDTTFQEWLDQQTARAKALKVKGKGKFKLSRAVAKKQKEILQSVGLETPGRKAKKAAPRQEAKQAEKATQVGEKETLEGMISGLYLDGKISEKQSDRYMDKIEQGELVSVRESLQRLLGEDFNFDREYSSKVLQRLPDKQKIKAETLKATIARGDVKAKERAMWEEFLLAHPEGFSLEEAKAALEQNILPLEFDLTDEYATYGARPVLDTAWPETQLRFNTVIWKNAYVRGESPHFQHPQYLMHSRRADTRTGQRYIMELQSDLFQKETSVGVELSPQLQEELRSALEEESYLTDLIRDFETLQGEELQTEWKLVKSTLPSRLKLPATPTPEGLAVLLDHLRWDLSRQVEQIASIQKTWELLGKNEQQILANVESVRKTWWERLIREEIAQGVEDGLAEMYFPTGNTVALIEGWQKEHRLDQLQGVTFTSPAGDTVIADGRLDFAGTDLGIGTSKEYFWYKQAALPEELRFIPEALMQNGLRVDYGETQGIYDRYNKEIKRFLQKTFDAEFVVLNGYEWLRVEMQDKTKVVVNWDRENPLQASDPQIVLETFAGLSQEEMRTPSVVAQAAEMWERLKFDSPFFRRWGKDTKVVGLDGKPQEVFRGTGSAVSFLSKAERGSLTGVQSAKKAFWFTDNPANAQWYAQEAGKRVFQVQTEEARRKVQKLSKGIEEGEKLLGEIPEGGEGRQVVEGRVARLRTELRKVTQSPENRVVAQPLVQGFYLNMVNPLDVDLGGEAYDDKLYSGWLELAASKGHDGVIFRNTSDPLEGTMYAVFEPEQAKLSSNVGTFDTTDELHWDKASPLQQNVRGLSKGLGKFWKKEKLTALNTWAKMQDTFASLQNVAAMQPDALNLHSFMAKWGKALQLRNNLQEPAEELVKKMGQLSGNSKERVRLLHSVLKAEWKTGQLQTTLQGLDSDGVEVWGENAGMGMEAQELVAKWVVEDTPQLRRFLAEQGVDVLTEDGKAVLELYLETRNLILFHFNELGKGFKRKAKRVYGRAPLLLRQELAGINEMLGRLLQSPFVPQGNFGRYVLIVKQDKGPVAFGQRRKQVIFKKYYEDKAEFDRAYLEADRRAKGTLDLFVSSQVLEEQSGIPMQLPNTLLEKLGELDGFAEGQLDILSEVMGLTKYDRVAERFERLSKQVEGGNEDFTRVMADFAWRNANYIWKSIYRGEMQQSIRATKAEVRRAEQDASLTPEEKLEIVTRLRRNVGLMQRGLNYVVNPPNELQTMRSIITLVYLAGNLKTALMNVSTVLNTWAAVTSEYGELAGNKEFGKSLGQVWDLLLYKSKLDQGKIPAGKVSQEFNEMIGVLDQAIKDGVVDQSYAYFLAANANSSMLLSATGGRVARLGHTVAELGMMPFQLMEKLNRIHSLITFYKLERGRNLHPKAAYEIAVAKTNDLQNSYDAMNRPELLRGKKAALTMFMSYTLFMGRIMTGGYERAARIQAKALGRTTAPVWRGTTVKLWLVYLLLGGLMGLPFARDLMDIVQWLWRKLGFGNAEAELRQELDELMAYLGTDSNFAMHGLLHDVMGADVSTSFGLGNMLPGTDLLVKERPMTTLEMIGSAVTVGSGPAGNFWKSILEAAGELAKGDAVEAGKKMPGFIGNVSKAMDAHLQQKLKPTYGVITKKGVRMTWDEEKGEFRDITTAELGMMAAGFNLNILSENRARNYAMESEKYYWMTRRSDLKDRYVHAVLAGDKDLRLEVLAEVARFKEQVPDRKLAITGKELNESVQGRKKMLKATERFGTDQKKFRGVVGEVKEAYTPD